MNQFHLKMLKMMMANPLKIKTGLLFKFQPSPNSLKSLSKISITNLYEKTNVRLKCSKYRVSNNNNSTDAGQFHKDLKLLDEKDINRNNAPPIYTVVTYLDTTQMELLPFSHKDYNMNLVDSLKSFNDTVTVKMNPGDILMFYSILIHRGVFTLKSENRRIIQNFVCIPQDKYKHYNSKLLHVRCDGKCDPTGGNLMKSISSSKLMNPIFNYLLYLNSSMGYSSSWVAGGCSSVEGGCSSEPPIIELFIFLAILFILQLVLFKMALF